MGDRAQNARKTIRRFPDIEVGFHFRPHPISVPLLVVSGHAFGAVAGDFLSIFPGPLVQAEGESAHLMEPGISSSLRPR